MLRLKIWIWRYSLGGILFDNAKVNFIRIEVRVSIEILSDSEFKIEFEDFHKN